MTNLHMHPENCGPVIACGASAVSLDHEPGQPTGIDVLIDSVKRFLNGERTPKRAAAQRNLHKPGHAPVA